jgi:fused signal recognition particle receptor
VFEKLRQGLKGIVNRINSAGLTEKDLDPILWDLQLQLIGNDVSVEVAEKVCSELKERLLGEDAPRFGDKSKLIHDSLKASLESVMNGSGSIDLLKLVAETNRAGAIEQLEEHGRRLGVKVIRHRYGSDAAAVGFDAVEHAKARGVDVVLIDTAGRMQTNRNLMDELQKMKRVVQPDLTIMILDSLIGNDATEQATTFNDQVGFDAAVLTKVDADAKGGSSLSVSYLTGKPVIYVGVGQEYKDLQPFDVEWFAERLLENT